MIDLIGSSDPDTSVQAAMFVKLLFSSNTIQEYASSETVRAITGTISTVFWIRVLYIPAPSYSLFIISLAYRGGSITFLKS